LRWNVSISTCRSCSSRLWHSRHCDFSRNNEWVISHKLQCRRPNRAPSQ